MMEKTRHKGGFSLGWLAVATLWSAFLVLAFLAFAYGASDRHDFGAYYIWSASMVDGGPLYDGLAGKVYLYPPLLAQLIAPVVGLGEPVAATLFFAVNTMAMISIPWMLAPLVAPRWSKLVWVAPPLFYPFLHAMYIGQVTIILAALLTAAWTSYHERAYQRAGLLLALAAWIKVWPAYLVIYFILRRDWQVFRGVVIGGMSLLVFQVVLGGFDLMAEYFALFFDLFTQGQPQGDFQNLSVFGFATRTMPDNEAWLRYGILAVLLGVTVWLTLQPADDVRHFDLGYSAFIPIALLSGSTLWTTALPPIYFCFVIVAKNIAHPILTLALISAYGVLTIYHLVLLRMNAQTLPNIISSSGMLALLILWGLGERKRLAISRTEDYAKPLVQSS